MSGIKIIDALPETFRFPEWRDDIYYAADSVVRYASYMAINDSDSEALRTNLYIAIDNVPIGSGIPRLRADLWASITTSASVPNDPTTLLYTQVVDNDSDILQLQNIISQPWDFGIQF